MQIEFTGRQVVVGKKLRTLAQSQLERIGRLLGRSTSAHIVLSTEKHRRIVEITVQARQQTIIGVAEAAEFETALRGALEKTERQAVRLKDRIKSSKKREAGLRGKRESAIEEPTAAAPRRRAANRKQASAENGVQLKRNGKTIAIPVTVHSFPVRAVIHETHVHRTSESVALRPMTIEEAVKEAEFRDRDVFLFRDPAGSVKVLHRKRDGRIELIEEP